MGALRASELDTHGMIGVGKVYGWYRDGVIESDDEVAVSTNPDTFESISVPLVNMRETLKAALAEGLVTGEEHDSLLELAINTYYPDRSYLELVKEGIKKFDDGLFDLVITDILMQGGNGDDIVRHIRSSDRQSTPVIGISGTPWLLNNSDFDMVLTKPFPLKTLVNAIHDLSSTSSK